VLLPGWPAVSGTAVARRREWPVGVVRSAAADSRAGWIALAVVLAFGVAQNAVRFHNYRLGLLGDDYGFLLARPGLSVHSLLAPYNEHLSAVAVLAYRALFALVGISTAVPYIALLFLTMSACAALAYAYGRRTLGPWLALGPPLVLVTLGPAAEGLLWPAVSSVWAAVAFWLGGMLLVERDRPLNDALGCVLFTLGVGCFSIVPALLPATALALVLRSGWRRALRRAWTVAIPAGLWVAWWVAYQPHSGHNIAQMPDYVVDSFVATVTAISGVGSSSVGAPLAGVVLALAVARCLALRRVPREALYMGLGLLTVWVALGVTANALEPASESRYQFHNGVLLMVALAPLAPRVRPTRARAALLAALLAATVAVIVTLNMGRYGAWETTYAYQESIANAELAALEVARPAVVNPDALAFVRFEPGLLWPFTPHAYYDAIDAHGSPVRIGADLVRAPAPARAQADVVIARVEGIAVAASRASSGTARPRSASGEALQPAGTGCARIAAGAATSGFAVLAPRGGLLLRPAAGPPVGVGLARFADPPTPVALESVLGASEAAVPLRRDASTVPWRVVLTAAQAVTVCSLA
jgi:hypothetical protein